MDRSLIELARWWSWRRQRLDRSCRGVEDCLRSVIGVYSANPSGPLSLLARVPRLLKGAAAEGVIGTKKAVRIPAMRNTVFLVPTETADQVFAATRGSGAPYAWVLKRHGISEKSYARLHRDILLAAGLPKTLDEIRTAITRPPKALGAVLQAMCAEGEMVRVTSSSIRANDLTYAATKVWLGRPFADLDHDASLAWLAGEYLTAFGPASIEDFAWWSGAARGRAEQAIRSHATTDVGDGLLLHERDARAFGQTRPHAGRVNLLPKWDCYTMGYAPDSRARFAHPSLLPLLYDKGGDAAPAVLVEGEVHGTWAHRARGDSLTITMSMFDKPGPRLRAALEAELDLVAGFLEAARFKTEWVAAARPPRRPPARAATARGSRRRGAGTAG